MGHKAQTPDRGYDVQGTEAFPARKRYSKTTVECILSGYGKKENGRVFINLDAEDAASENRESERVSPHTKEKPGQCDSKTLQ